MLKVVFNDDQGFELGYLPRYSRWNCSKVGKVLCSLISSQPTSQVPWPNKDTGLALQAISSAFPSLGLSTTGLHSFQAFSPAILFRWCWKTLLTAGGVMPQLPWFSGRARGYSSFVSISQIGCPTGMVQELVYELIPMAVHSRGTLPTWYCLFSVEYQIFLHPSHLDHYWAMQLPRVVASPLVKMGPKCTLHNKWVCDSAICLGMKKTRV